MWNFRTGRKEPFPTRFYLCLLLFFTGPIGLCKASALRKGPYLIYPGVNTRMMVLWQLDHTRKCRLDWGKDKTYSDNYVVTAEYGTDHQHKYTISGLAPGTKYYYRVKAGSNEYPGSFRTAPPEDSNSVKFLVYGDTRTGVFEHDLVDETIVDTFEDDPSYQTFLILTGDWVDDGEEEEDWDEEFFNPAALNSRELQANLPVNGCIGNHEWNENSNPSTYFDKYWPYPCVQHFYWSFDYGPVHIAVIDQYDADYAPGTKQFQWLVNDLAECDKQWKVLVLHEPGYSAGGGHNDNRAVQNYIHPLCEEYGVQIVFCGHNHYYARCDKNGIKHITAGGGGAPLRTPDPNHSPYVEIIEKTYHFCRIEIKGKNLHFRAVRPDGTLIDVFRLVSSPPQDRNPAP